MTSNKTSTYQAIIAIGAKLDKTFGPTMKSAQKGMQMMGTGFKVAGAATAAGAATVLAGATAAVTGAGKLQAEMSNIGTLLDGDVNARIQSMQQELLAVSNITGIVTSDLTDGMYQVVSAFGDSADAAKQLEIAAVAARAGNASTTDSISLLSAVTKGYNDTSIEAMQRASDLAFQTVKLGQTSYPELAVSIGKVIPIANAMKGSQEDLFGAMATLTGVTGGTAEVATQLRGVYQGFLQPTTAMTKAMQKLGYADGQVMMESLGLQGTLTALRDSVAGNELAFANLFGSIEAKNAVLALTGAQAKNLTDKTMAMYEATNVTNRAFAWQTANLSAMLSKMANYGKNALAMAGTAMLPQLMNIMESTMPILENAFNKLPGIMEKVFPIISNGFFAISKIVSSFGQKVMPYVTQGFELLTQKILPAVIPLIQKLFTIFGSGTGKLTQFAVTLLPQIESILRILGEKALPVVVGLIQKTAVVLGPVAQKVGELTGKLFQMINVVLPPAIAFFKDLGDSVVEAFSLFIMPCIDKAMGALGGLIDFVTGVFSSDWTMAWQGIRDTFGNVFGSLYELIKIPFNIIIRSINSVFESIGSFSVPDWVPVIGGSAISLPQIPMLYTGVQNFPGGPAIVGERGMELLDLPKGTNVYNHQETRGILDRVRDFGSGSMEMTPIFNINITGPITQAQAEQAAGLTEKAFRAMMVRVQRENKRARFSG